MTASPLTDAQHAPMPVRAIVDHARRAPSVHNTQPWQWKSTADGLELWADWSRHLELADPEGRNLTISCGTALHHTLVAARALGWTAVVDHLPDPSEPHLLARIQLRRAVEVPAEAPIWLRAMADRCTDRRRFTSWPVPESRLQRLCESAEHHGARIAVLTDEPVRHRLDLLIARAMLAQAHDVRLLEEQEQWLREGGGDGLLDPGDLPWGDGHGRRYPTRFDHEPPPAPERDRHPVARTDGILVVSTPSDGPLSWLHAGEALSALWLEATLQGLSVVPLSQVVEVEETRVALGFEVLGAELEGQIVLRVGWQEIGRSDLPRTPRRPVADLLGT